MPLYCYWFKTSQQTSWISLNWELVYSVPCSREPAARVCVFMLWPGVQCGAPAVVRAYAQVHAHKGTPHTPFKQSAPRSFRVVNIKVNNSGIAHTFPPPCVQNFDFPLPSPLRVFEMVVDPQQEYPLVCIGVSRGTQFPVSVNYINLNSNTSWFTNSGLGTLKSPAFNFFIFALVWTCMCVCVCVC